MGNMNEERKPAQSGFSRRDFLRVAGAALLAAEAACSPIARSVVDTITPGTPEAPATATSTPFPSVELSSESVIQDFLSKCGPSCEGMDRESVFGWSLGENNFAFFLDKNGDQAGRMLINDIWYPIYGTNVDNTVIWLLPTSGVTPVAPSLGTTESEIVLQYDLSPVFRDEDILVQSYNPTSKADPETFIIPKSSPSYGGVKNAAQVKFETPTPEPKEYSICNLENFRDCPIPAEDLLDGSYLRWLYTLSKPFPSDVITNIPMEIVRVDFHDAFITYDIDTAPNFVGAGDRKPFRRLVTSGHVIYEGNEYIVVPVEYYDKNQPEQSQWVITVMALRSKTGPIPEQYVRQHINTMSKQMNVTPISTEATGVRTMQTLDAPDPLVTQTFTRYKDMMTRFRKFASGEDTAALSQPGIILLTSVAISNWFK